MRVKSPIPVTDSTFDQEVNKSSLPVVVYFWANWCGPCKQVGPTLEQLSDEMKGRIRLFKVDVDENPNIANTFGVRGLPSMFILDRNSDIVANRSGSASKQELKSWIQDSI